MDSPYGFDISKTLTKDTHQSLVRLSLLPVRMVLLEQKSDQSFGTMITCSILIRNILIFRESDYFTIFESHRVKLRGFLRGTSCTYHNDSRTILFARGVGDLEYFKGDRSNRKVGHLRLHYRYVDEYPT